jgi:ATP synthase protein I
MQQHGISRPPLLKVYGAQLAFLLLFSALFLLAYDQVLGYSLLAGGLTSFVPNAYFARHAFRYTGAQSAAAVAASFYRGEAGKFLMTVVMFASIFLALRPIVAWAVFVAYGAMWLLNIVSAAYISSGRK